MRIKVDHMIKIKTSIIFLILIIILLCTIIASAEQEPWPYNVSNEAPSNILQHVRYDFEEGSNCITFDNMYPEVAEFHSVVHDSGTDYPSYVEIGGTMCGLTRSKMYIYPYDNGYLEKHDWIYIVNGNKAFSPITGPDEMGGYWPGRESLITFKPDTRHVSFLVSTGGNLSVRLYDARGNLLDSDKIKPNHFRTYPNPSNFTRYSFTTSTKDIAIMELKGSFNMWLIDDLIVGGGPGYITGDFSWAAERLKQLLGAQYLEYGLGYNLLFGEFYTADEIMNKELPYWNQDTKEMSVGTGIYDTFAIIWAYNQEANYINNCEINDMASKDFKEIVDPVDRQPGDVVFIDYDADGCYDEIAMCTERHLDPDTGMWEDVIRIIPEAGVHETSYEYLDALYGKDVGIKNHSFLDVKRLPSNNNGKGKSPYPKIPSKYI